MAAAKRLAVATARLASYPPVTSYSQPAHSEPEDLFYLGFHFVEGDRSEREFGAQALRLLLKRSPRSKIAKDARSKLRSAGLK